MLAIKDRKPTWEIASVWNDLADVVEKRTPMPRDYLWASELGSSDIDLYLKLTGVEPSNGFDSRAQRKFNAGLFWEWFIVSIFKRLGYEVGTQERVEYTPENGLKITGKIDMLIGGTANREQMQSYKKVLRELDFPERYLNILDQMEEMLIQKYGTTPLKKIPFEIKSASAFMYDAQYKFGEPASNHALQDYHYVMATGCDEGAVFYVSKDDARVTQIPIWADDENVRKEYISKSQRMKYYLDNNIMPEREKLIIWDEAKGRFSDNWNVKYSDYLTKLYGFEHETEYSDAFKSKIASWNRVIGRMKKGETMTKSNLGYIEEIKLEFPNFEELVAKANPVEEETAETGAE